MKNKSFKCRLTFLILLFMIILAITGLTVTAGAYNLNDLWAIEVVLNKTHSVNEEVIIDNGEVLFPVDKLTYLLNINIKKSNGLITSKDNNIKIDLNSNKYLSDGNWKDIDKVAKLENQYYFSLNDLEKMFNIQCRYDRNLLIIFINGKINNKEDQPLIEEEFIEKELPANSWPYVDFDFETDFSEFNLDYGLHGRFLKGEYYIGASFDGQEHKLNSAELVYNFDDSSIRLMKDTNVLLKEEDLFTEEVTGIQYRSADSPFSGGFSHLIDLEGEAPEGTIVSLYVNGYMVEEEKAEEDGYSFEDVLLHNGYNEIKIVKELPTGERKEIIKSIYINSDLLKGKEKRYNIVAGTDKDDNSIVNGYYSYGLSDDLTINANFLDYKDKDMYSAGAAYNISDNSIFDFNYLQDDNGNGYKVGLDNATRHTYSGLAFTKYNDFQDKDYDKVNAYLSAYRDDLYFNTRYQGKFNNENKHDLSSYIRWSSGRLRNRLQYNYSITEEDGHSTEDSKSIGYRANYKMTDNLSTYAGISRDLLDRNNEYSLGFAYSNDRVGAYGMNVSYEEEEPDQLSSRLYWNKDFGKLDMFHTLTINYDDGNYSYPYRLGFKYDFDDSTRLKAVLKKDDDDIYDYSLSFNKDFRNDISFDLDLDYSSNTEFEAVAGLSGSFGFIDGKLVWGQRSLSSGIIKGVVFNDKNKNGIREENETLMSNIPVCLNGDKVIITGNSGDYRFNNVKPGKQDIAFDIENLDIKFSPTTYKKEVIVHKGDITEVNLGLTVTGMVDGYIKIKGFETLEDYMKKEFNIAKVKLILSNPDYPVQIFNNGYYFIDQLPPGEYSLKVDKSNLPQWLTVEKGEYTFEITDKGEYLDNLNIILNVEK